MSKRILCAAGVLAAVAGVQTGAIAAPTRAAATVNASVRGVGTVTQTYADPATGSGSSYVFDVRGAFADNAQAIAGAFHLTLASQPDGYPTGTLTVTDTLGTSSYTAGVIPPGVTGNHGSCWLFDGTFNGCVNFSWASGVGLPGNASPATASGTLSFAQ